MQLTRGEHVDIEQDLKTLGLGILAFLAVRAVFLLPFRPFAKYLLVSKSVEERKGLNAEQLEAEKANDKEVDKFCKSGWHCVAYVALWIWGLKIMQETEWSILNTKSVDPCWVGYPHSGEEKVALKPFYFTQIAWYGHTFIESAMVDRGRGDFWMMMIHHVLAVALLVGSFWGNAHRVGTTVVFEQDISDIIMYVSKMITKSEKRVPFFASDLVHGFLLLILVVGWWSTRCILLGFIVYSGYTTVSASLPGILWPLSPDADALSIFLIVQLSVFFVLQVIWGCAIVKVAVRKVMSGKLHDHWGDADKKKKAK